MNANKDEKRLKAVKKGIFFKIKNFLKKIFTKMQDYESQYIILDENNNFRQNIKIKEDEEKNRILELQQEYKNGNIDESQIEENDYNKLIKLYDEQNEKLRQEIEMYKIETAKILKEMKNT